MGRWLDAESFVDFGPCALTGEAAAPHWLARGLDPHPVAGLFRHLYVDTCPPALQSPEIASITAVTGRRCSAPARL